MFTLQTLPAVEKDDRFAQVAKEAGFSLHAGVDVTPAKRGKGRTHKEKADRLYKLISQYAKQNNMLDWKCDAALQYYLKDFNND